ncbi:MAG: class I SAM-dependent methyltransferase [Deltaproteobacteria bacterium]|nr:class I SAM-dependent methyltransferase [Deltaproteobacteria bacterium]
MTQIVTCPPDEHKPAPIVDLAAVKARQQATWASGDFAVIGTTIQIVGESLCEAVDVEAGSRVLDVACGNGNAALAAARRWCRVTGLDYVPELLARARGRAAAEGLEVAFVDGDAEDLPFNDGHFDAALSTFGVMFAPDQERAAAELLRVVRPGGKVGLASWTPDGFIGHLLRTVGKHVPPPAGVASPIGWGTEARLADLFRGVRSMQITRATYTFRYESAAHFIDVFRRFYGPTFQAFGKLDAKGQAALTNDIVLLAERFNRSKRSFIVPAEYLEVVVER